MRDDLREIGPHVMIAPPRFWEAMCSEYQVKIADAGLAQARGHARLALALGERVAERELSRQPVGPWLATVRGGLAHLLAFRTLLDKFGLSRIRYAYTGGAPLGPEIFRFFRAIGLNLKQVYGQTESSGICVLHPDGEVRAETVGKPTPGTQRPHLRRRRDPHRVRQRVPRLLQEPGGDGAGAGRRLAPHRRRRPARRARATWSMIDRLTGRSAASPTARASPRRSSRTS